MALTYYLLLLLTHNLLVSCASAAAHKHSLDYQERELDGSYRPRDSDHYGGEGGHNFEFDHEAILGSVKEAEEYDKLSPDEAKRRLALLLPKMDLNGDQEIDRLELKQWILNSFVGFDDVRKLSQEEAQERMSETDDNRDGIVTWSEYLLDAFGVEKEDEVGPDDHADTGMLLQDEKAMWAAADKNGDGNLDFQEFAVFSNPEEHAEMHPHLVKQTMREKDANKDSKIDFNEFVAERGTQQDKEWLITQKDKFDRELDLNEDGILDESEVHAWVIPENEEIAIEEVDHLFASADDDHSDRLSFSEILAHHDAFVGSEATDYGGDLMGEHFDDEL